MERPRLLLALLLNYCLLPFVAAQETPPPPVPTPAEYAAAVARLVDFLALPNDGNYPEQVAANLRWCDEAFRAEGFTTRKLETPGAPLLFAERRYHDDSPAVLFYLQIDGQPVDTASWDQDSPYRAVLKAPRKDGSFELVENPQTPPAADTRLFARSSSDSKGPALAFLTALGIMRERGEIPPYNVKVIMDFQEELGSPTLPAAVEANRALFAARYLVIMDGTRHVSNLPTLTFGARGMTTVSLRVFGANKALHSGQYGNFAPNPVFTASRLLAAMKDEDGRVLVPGWYDGVALSEDQKREMNQVPESREDIERMVGIARSERVGETYQEALQYPSLNVRGLRAAWTGKEVRTLIPEEVIIEIDLRLVPETPGERQVKLLRRFIADRGFHFVDGEPTVAERERYPKLIAMTHKIGSAPFRTDLGGPFDAWLTRAVTRALGAPPIRMRTTGGSQPMAPFVSKLGLPAVSLRIPNPDNSIHAPNENLRLGNFYEGIRECLGVLTEPLGE